MRHRRVSWIIGSWQLGGCFGQERGLRKRKVSVHSSHLPEIFLLASLVLQARAV